MKLVAIATSPAQIINIGLYIEHLGLSFHDCMLVHVLSGKETDNELSRNTIARNDWGQVQSLPHFVSYRPDQDDLRKTWGKQFRYSGMILSPLRRGLRQRLMHAFWNSSQQSKLLDDCNKAIAADNKKRFKRVYDGTRAQGELAVRQAYAYMVKTILPRFDTLPDMIVLGDYRPISFRLIMAEYLSANGSVALVDDGSATRHAIRFRAGNAQSNEILRHIPKRLGPHDPFIYHEPESLIFFSIYDDQKTAEIDTFIYNDYYERLAAQTDWTRTDEIWIIGANHAEANIAHMEEYIRVVSNVRSWFPERTVIYFAHRREDSDKLERLRRELDIQIHSTEFGIEQHTLSTNTRPATIIAFGSTVVDNFARLFRDCDTDICVAIPPNGYFTSSARALHVKSVIQDNILHNPGVFSLKADRWNAAWFNRTDVYIKPLRCEPRPAAHPMQLAAEAKENITRLAPHNDLYAITDRFRESSIKGLHRITLGRYNVSRAFVGLLGLVSEGRSVFRLRVSEVGASKRKLDLRFDCDHQGNLEVHDEMGSLFLSCDSTWDRRSRLLITFVPRVAETTIQLDLLTQRGAQKHSSLFTGNPNIGFAVEQLTLATQACHVVMPTKTVLIPAQIRPSGLTPLLVRGRSQSRLLVLHNNTAHLSETALACDINDETLPAILLKVPEAERVIGLRGQSLLCFTRSARGLEIQGHLVLDTTELEDSSFWVSDCFDDSDMQTLGTAMTCIDNSERGDHFSNSWMVTGGGGF
jgi:hypothetical protein